MGGGSGTGVVVLPPLGYEHLTSHRALRALAEGLAERGCHALRVDFDGTGDSAGDQLDGGRLAAWLATAGHAVAELRTLGIAQVGLVGLRFGATVALAEAARLGVDFVVAWAPVVSGRRYVREISLLAIPAPEPVGAVALGGHVFTPETMSDIAGIDLAALPARPAAEVLLVDRDERPASAGLISRLGELGSSLDHRLVGDLAVALDRPAEESEVPRSTVEATCAWVASRSAAPTGRSAPPTVGSARRSAHPPARRAVMAWRGGTLSEEIVSLSDRQLVGVMGQPGGPSLATVVFLNSGSETHTGPGRAWVEYCRSLNVAGYETLRVDFRAWGESPDDDHAPGRPYDRHTGDDTRDLVAALRRRGDRPIVLAGLCAGAWVALRVATDTALGGVIAINPQLYWQPGDPVEALLSDTRVRRADEIAHFKRHGDRLEGERPAHPAETWLRALQGRRLPILTLFAAGDDGVEFLQDRLPRTWGEVVDGGAIHLAQIDVDHPMHQFWGRPAVLAAMTRFLDANFGRPDTESC